jgi:hypothetical protein
MEATSNSTAATSLTGTSESPGTFLFSDGEITRAALDAAFRKGVEIKASQQRQSKRI